MRRRQLSSSHCSSGSARLRRRSLNSGQSRPPHLRCRRRRRSGPISPPHLHSSGGLPCLQQRSLTSGPSRPPRRSSSPRRRRRCRSRGLRCLPHRSLGSELPRRPRHSSNPLSPPCSHSSAGPKRRWVRPQLGGLRSCTVAVAALWRDSPRAIWLSFTAAVARRKPAAVRRR